MPKSYKAQRSNADWMRLNAKARSRRVLDYSSINGEPPMHTRTPMCIQLQQLWYSTRPRLFGLLVMRAATQSQSSAEKVLARSLDRVQWPPQPSRPHLAYSLPRPKKPRSLPHATTRTTQLCSRALPLQSLTTRLQLTYWLWWSEEEADYRSVGHDLRAIYTKLPHFTRAGLRRQRGRYKVRRQGWGSCYQGIARPLSVRGSIIRGVV